jgi:hypothetical protein
MPAAVLLVLTTCTEPAREEEFNRWYNEVHVGDILAIPHFLAAQRFERVGRPNPNEPEATYLAVYELDTSDAAVAAKALGEGVRELAAKGRMIDCLKSVSLTYFSAIGERVEAKV